MFLLVVTDKRNMLNVNFFSPIYFIIRHFGLKTRIWCYIIYGVHYTVCRSKNNLYIQTKKVKLNYDNL